jgi:hypothetical protein
MSSAASVSVCRDVGPDIGLVKIEEHVGRKLASDLFCGFACVDSHGKAQIGERKRSDGRWKLEVGTGNWTAAVCAAAFPEIRKERTNTPSAIPGIARNICSVPDRNIADRVKVRQHDSELGHGRRRRPIDRPHFGARLGFYAGQRTAQGVGHIFHTDPVLPAVDEFDEVHVGERGAGEKTIIEVPRGVVDHDEFADDPTVAGALEFCDSIRMFPSTMDLPIAFGFASCASTTSVDSAIASPIMPIRQAPAVALK